MTITIDELINIYNNEIKILPNVIFEIGAREANDSVKLKECFLDAEVYAFEAHPECFKKHSKDVVNKNIKYFNIGMWNSEVDLIFYDKNIDSGISSFRNRGDQYGTDTFILKTSTPYLFCKKNNIKNIDILKIDVEGCTYEILDGFGNMIKNVNLLHIETEQEEYFMGQTIESIVFNLLNKNNFKLLKHSLCCLRQFDSIWVNNNFIRE